MLFQTNKKRKRKNCLFFLIQSATTLLRSNNLLQSAMIQLVRLKHNRKALQKETSILRMKIFSWTRKSFFFVHKMFLFSVMLYQPDSTQSNEVSITFAHFWLKCFVYANVLIFFIYISFMKIGQTKFVCKLHRNGWLKMIQDSDSEEEHPIYKLGKPYEK